jgi:hypothetical protein
VWWSLASTITIATIIAIITGTFGLIALNTTSTAAKRRSMRHASRATSDGAVSLLPLFLLLRLAVRIAGLSASVGSAAICPRGISKWIA